MNRFRDALKGYHLAMQISGTLVLIIFCSLFSGIWLDKKLGTKPWLMLVLMVLGFAFAMYTVIRAAKEAQNQ